MLLYSSNGIHSTSILFVSLHHSNLATLLHARGDTQAAQRSMQRAMEILYDGATAADGSISNRNAGGNSGDGEGNNANMEIMLQNMAAISGQLQPQPQSMIDETADDDESSSADDDETTEDIKTSQSFQTAHNEGAILLSSAVDAMVNCIYSLEWICFSLTNMSSLLYCVYISFTVLRGTCRRLAALTTREIDLNKQFECWKEKAKANDCP